MATSPANSFYAVTCVTSGGHKASTAAGRFYRNNTFMRATYLWAVAMCLLLVSWLASGQLDQQAVNMNPQCGAQRAKPDAHERSGSSPKFELCLHGATADALRQCSRQDQNKRTVKCD